MALAKSKTERKILVKVLLGVLFITNLSVSTILIDKNNKLSNELNDKQDKVEELTTQVKTLQINTDNLEEKLSYKLNSKSDIRIIREDLIKAIEEAVKDRNREIKDIDILRALSSAENRVMDEYITIASLILATMEIESNFKYITNENSNGTSDHGIMQVNDVIIPHIKEALGEDIDPINSKDDNVQAGSWEIYECYLKAKEKHPQDVIWWTYAYYNRGLYFEYKDNWTNPNNPNYKAVHDQANARSNKFKESFNSYYEALSAIK